ncbi:MAG: DUF1194 domain-containing protein [Pseudomonadota bacterium]
MRLVFALLTAMAGTQAASDTCRLSLALALDVSGSVDAREYRLQTEGVAAALNSPDVRALLFAFPDAPVALAVYEWSASRHQRMVQDWVLLKDEVTLNRVIGKLTNMERQVAPEPTGLAAALAFGHQLIAEGPDCWDATLDVSGDGKNNDWPTPQELRERRTLAGLRINALVVVEDRDEERAGARETGELPAYFNTQVIQGPGAFVEVARGFQDYRRAMTRKLLRELATQPLGSLETKSPKNLRRF